MRALPLLALIAATSTTVAEPLYEKLDKDKPRQLRCPTAAPCVVAYDGTFMVGSNASATYYVLDFGSPDAPLREGTTTLAEVFTRASPIIRELLTAMRATSAKISCTVADRLPELAGLGETVLVTLPASKVTPLGKSSAAELNAAWAAAYHQAEPDKPAGEILSPLALSKMTGSTFATPTLLTPRFWLGRSACKGGTCGETVMHDASLFVLFSPESADAYVADATVIVPSKTHQTTAKRAQARALASISATLAALGHRRVAVRRSAMCATDLLPNRGWFDYKP